jgi:parallel beta-helix repeat protein
MNALIATLGVLLLSATLADSTTITVATTGSDAAGCRGTMRTIGAARGCLSPGDTLLMQGGTYQESLTDGAFPAGTASAPITIKAAPGAQVIWQPISGCRYPDDCRFPLYLKYSNEHHITFENLIFDGNNRAGAAPSIVGDSRASPNEGPHDIVFLNCEFRNADGEIGVGNARNIRFTGGSVHDNGDGSGLRHGFYTNHILGFTAECMEIYNNEGYGIHHWAGYDANTAASTDVVIRSNRIYNNGLAHGQCGVIIDHTQSGTIVDNRIYDNYRRSDNHGCGLRLGYSLPTSGVMIARNTVSENRDWGIHVLAGGGNTIEQNVLWHNGQDLDVSAGNTMRDNTIASTAPAIASSSQAGGSCPARPTQPRMPTPIRLRAVAK